MMPKSPFIIPAVVFFGLLVFGLVHFLKLNPLLGTISIGSVIAIGSWKLLKDTWESLKKGSFALDYIALLAIATGVMTQNYVVAGVIVLMMSGGNALEDFAQVKAKESLTALKNRLPNKVQVRAGDGTISTRQVDTVEVGSTILIRKGEVVPLDGTLLDGGATLDESSLTGEAVPVSRSQGELVRSGALNTGEVVTLCTTVTPQDSTYQQIIKLVEEAEAVQTPFVQLADTLSGWFTLVALLMAGLAYIISGDLTRSLAVLVIATPCPLILATPIALVGGMSAAARYRIIFKQLASLESLASVTTLVFDKTGTLTLGKPQLEEIVIKDKRFSTQDILQIASSIERNSLHPYAVAIVDQATHQQLKPLPVTNVSEKIGKGLSGTIENVRYTLESDPDHADSQVVLKAHQKILAVFSFLDRVKESSISVLDSLQKQGLQLFIFTGDTKERTEDFVQELRIPITFMAALSPSEKQTHLKQLKQEAKVAMIGDGINDAPALALADVGLAFSHQQHTAASEAADVILLGNDIKAVQISWSVARYTMSIAKQSMYVGMGLSLVGMVLALQGILPPIAGAITQEVIDVVVILNALRAAFWRDV